MTRGRRPALSPTRALNTTLDEGLLAKVDLVLYSEVEQRVPKGAYQRFLSKLIRRFFEWRELDLAPYVGALPGTYVITASPETIDVLRRKLEA